MVRCEPQAGHGGGGVGVFSLLADVNCCPGESEAVEAGGEAGFSELNPKSQVALTGAALDQAQDPPWPVEVMIPASQNSGKARCGGQVPGAESETEPC